MKRHDRKTTRQDIDFLSIEFIDDLQNLAHERRTSFSQLVRDTMRKELEISKNEKK
jgi:hypothetical protein